MTTINSHELAIILEAAQATFHHRIKEGAGVYYKSTEAIALVAAIESTKRTLQAFKVEVAV